MSLVKVWRAKERPCWEQSGAESRKELEVPCFHMGPRFMVWPATPGVEEEVTEGTGKGIEGSMEERSVAGQMCKERWRFEEALLDFGGPDQ